MENAGEVLRNFGSEREFGKLCILRGFLKNEEFGLGCG
jgi:hypothetical protein